MVQGLIKIMYGLYNYSPKIGDSYIQEHSELDSHPRPLNPEKASRRWGFWGFNGAMRRRLLWTGLTGTALQAQSLAEEIPLRPLTAQNTTLYGLDIELDQKRHTLLMDTQQPLSWVNRSQTQLTAPIQDKREQIFYPDGSTVQGQRLTAKFRLGTWQQTLPILVTEPTEAPLGGAVDFVQRSVAQGVLGLGGLSMVRRYTLRCGGSRPSLILNPSYYRAALTLPLRKDYVLLSLNQDPMLLTALHSTLPFVLMRPTVALQLGLQPQDWLPLAVPGMQLGQVTRLVKMRLGPLYVRFDPPRVLVVEAPLTLLNGMDLVLGLPFFEQVSVTWDTTNRLVHLGER